MIVQFEKCGKVYNDVNRWTYCPHESFGFPAAVPFPPPKPQETTVKTLADIATDEASIKKYFKDLGAAVSEILTSLDGDPERRCYFILLVADDSDVAQYVSNAERASCIKWLRETADRLEGREDRPR